MNWAESFPMLYTIQHYHEPKNIHVQVVAIKKQYFFKDNHAELKMICDYIMFVLNLNVHINGLNNVWITKMMQKSSILFVKKKSRQWKFLPQICIILSYSSILPVWILLLWLIVIKSRSRCWLIHWSDRNWIHIHESNRLCCIICYCRWRLN